jgi:hypothetical protein
VSSAPFVHGSSAVNVWQIWVCSKFHQTRPCVTNVAITSRGTFFYGLCFVLLLLLSADFCLHFFKLSSEFLKYRFKFCSSFWWMIKTSCIFSMINWNRHGNNMYAITTGVGNLRAACWKEVQSNLQFCWKNKRKTGLWYLMSLLATTTYTISAHHH